MDQTPPPPAVNNDDRLWIVFCHISLLLGFGIILPLIVYLVKKADSPNTAEHAKEALNFHISVYLYGFISALLTFVVIGLLLLPALSIFALVCSIVAAIKASEGKFYRYPLTLRLVK